MTDKPTYEELEQRVKELEKEDRQVNRQDITLEILKTLPGTLNVIDTGYNIVMVGGEIARTLESIDRVIGEKCYKVFQERDNPCPWCKVDNVLKTGEIINETTTSDDHREKVVKKPLSIYVRPLKDKGGNIIGAIELGTDITQIRKAEEKQKRAEETLRESEAQKKAILDASIDVIRLVDKDMKIIWANKTTTIELKAFPEQLVGNFCYEAVAGRDTPCPGCPTKKALKSGKIERTLMRQKELKGIKEETYWDDYAVPVKNETGDIVNIIQISRNVTDHKQAEEEKERLEAQLQQTQKMEAIATLAGGVAHEFNNALTGIMGNIELLKMDLPEDERRDKYFGAMKGSGHRMSRLTDQLLAYAQGGKYQPRDLKLDDFVIQTLPILQHDLSPTVRVETHFPKDISYIKADYAQMQMVLSAISAESKAQGAKAVKQPELELAIGEGTILMIEDEDVVIEVTQAMLEMLGYRVMVGKTGKDAIHITETFDGQIDLALLDIKLPDMEGGKVYPLIMKARPNLKVIVFSGYPIEGPARKILDAGAQDFIQKPFSIATLSEKFKEVLEGK